MIFPGVQLQNTLSVMLVSNALAIVIVSNALSAVIVVFYMLNLLPGKIKGREYARVFMIQARVNALLHLLFPADRVLVFKCCFPFRKHSPREKLASRGIDVSLVLNGRLPKGLPSKEGRKKMRKIKL